MPIATVTRTVTLLDGSIEKTIERLHKDKAGNVIKVLSKTTEIIPSTTGPLTKSSVTPTPALEDPDEDYLVAQLRKRTQHSNRSSSEQGNNGSALSIHSNASGSAVGSFHSYDGMQLSTTVSSQGDSMVDHLRRVNLQNKNSQSSPQVIGSSLSIHSNKSESDIGSFHSLDGTKTNSASSHGDSLVDHLRRVSLQNNQGSSQTTQATAVRPRHSVQHIEASPVPSVMVEAEPIRPDRCTYKTVSKEFVTADGTIIVRTEKLKFYPNGSVQILETRDQVKWPSQQPQVVTNPTQAPPIRMQTATVPQAAAVPNFPIRIQTSAVPRPHTMANPTPVVAAVVHQQTQPPQGPQNIPTHPPGAVARPQPSRPQIIQQDEGQHLETAEDALAFAETAHELFGGGQDESGGITFNVNFDSQQPQASTANPNRIRQAMQWGRIGLRAARLGADILGYGECDDEAADEEIEEACDGGEE